MKSEKVCLGFGDRALVGDLGGGTDNSIRANQIAVG